MIGISSVCCILNVKATDSFGKLELHIYIDSFLSNMFDNIVSMLHIDS